MTLQGCPGGTGFYKSVNARKIIVCALYIHEKWLPKMAPVSKGAAPDGASGVAAPENGSWLLEAAHV